MALIASIEDGSGEMLSTNDSIFRNRMTSNLEIYKFTSDLSWNITEDMLITQRITLLTDLTENGSIAINFTSLPKSFENIQSNITSQDTEVNVTTSPEVEAPLKLFLVAPLTVMTLLTILLNLLVMVLTRTSPRLKSSSYIYVFSLAIADLCVGITSMIPFSIYNIHSYWPLHHSFCTIYICLDFGCCTVSMLHLCLLGYDRLVALSEVSIRGSAHRKEVIKRCILAWIVGLMLWIPAILYFRTSRNSRNEMDHRDCLFLPHKYYIITQSIFVYYIPIVAMVVIYVLVLIKLRNKVKTMNKYKLDRNNVKKNSNYEPSEASNSKMDGHKFNDDSNMKKHGQENLGYENESTQGNMERHEKGNELENENSEGSCGNNSVELSQSQKLEKSIYTKGKMNQLQFQKRDIHAVKTIGIITVTFLLCWLPFCLFWPIAAFCENCIPLTAYEASYWLAYLNSLVNPAIYFVMNKDFRSAVVTLGRRKRF